MDKFGIEFRINGLDASPTALDEANRKFSILLGLFFRKAIS